MADLDGVRDDGSPGERDLIATSVENLLGGSGSDTLVGSRANNSLWGGAGNDRLYGGDGNDYIAGGAGADYVSGGAGVDTVSYSDHSASLVVDLDGVADDGSSGERDLVATSVENVTGGSGADKLIGSSVNNVLYGRAGNDTMLGGVGADTFLGGPGSDTVSYADHTQPVKADLDGVRDDGTTTANRSESDLIDTATENITGGAASDELTGSAADNTLYGGAGADALVGADGADVISGQDGNDAISGGAGNDKLAGGAGADTIDGGDGTNVCGATDPSDTATGCDLTVSFAVDQLVLIRGRVRNIDGVAVPDVSVQAYSLRPDAAADDRTDSQGNFELAMPKTAMGTLSLSNHESNPSSFATLRLPSGFGFGTQHWGDISFLSDAYLDMTLPKTYRVTVKVIDGNGTPLPGVTLEKVQGDARSTVLWPGGPEMIGSQYPVRYNQTLTTASDGTASLWTFPSTRITGDLLYRINSLTLYKSFQFSVSKPLNVVMSP